MKKFDIKTFFYAWRSHPSIHILSKRQTSMSLRHILCTYLKMGKTLNIFTNKKSVAIICMLPPSVNTFIATFLCRLRILWSIFFFFWSSFTVKLDWEHLETSLAKDSNLDFVFGLNLGHYVSVSVCFGPLSWWKVNLHPSLESYPLKGLPP